jgi:hypothetical protein
MQNLFIGQKAEIKHLLKRQVYVILIPLIWCVHTSSFTCSSRVRARAYCRTSGLCIRGHICPGSLWPQVRSGCLLVNACCQDFPGISVLMGLAAALISNYIPVQWIEIARFTFFKVAPYLAETWLSHWICHWFRNFPRFSMMVAITNLSITIYPNSGCAKWLKMNGNDISTYYPTMSHWYSTGFQLFAKCCPTYYGSTTNWSPYSSRIPSNFHRSLRNFHRWERQRAGPRTEAWWHQVELPKIANLKVIATIPSGNLT